MAVVEQLTCPYCGAAVSTSTKECEYCGNPIVVRTINNIRDFNMPMLKKYANSFEKSESVDSLVGLGLCNMKLKLYDKAIQAFEKALDVCFDNPDIYYFYGIALLAGRKPFLAKRDEINKIEENINAAIDIEPKGIYYYFKAYIRCDHHERKGYIVNPNSKQLVNQAISAGLSKTDVEDLFTMIGQMCPSSLMVN